MISLLMVNLLGWVWVSVEAHALFALAGLYAGVVPITMRRLASLRKSMKLKEIGLAGRVRGAMAEIRGVKRGLF